MKLQWDYCVEEKLKTKALETSFHCCKMRHICYKINKVNSFLILIIILLTTLLRLFFVLIHCIKLGIKPLIFIIESFILVNVERIVDFIYVCDFVCIKVLSKPLPYLY